MKKRYLILAALAAVAMFSLGPATYAQLFQAPTGPGDSWNVYELVTAGATWKDANAAAGEACTMARPVTLWRLIRSWRTPGCTAKPVTATCGSD